MVCWCCCVVCVVVWCACGFQVSGWLGVGSCEGCGVGWGVGGIGDGSVGEVGRYGLGGWRNRLLV